MPARTSRFLNNDLYTWRPLGLTNAYRLVLALGLTSLFWFIDESGPTSTDIHTTVQICAVYFGLSVGAVYARQTRLAGFYSQVFALAAIDIGLINLIIFFGGEYISGLGLLLALAVACASVVIRPRYALLLAATASISILGQTIYKALEYNFDVTRFSQVGFLGLGLFMTALITSLLAKAARENEYLAQRQKVDLRDLRLLNEQIIQRMDSGVLVVEGDDDIKHNNQAAASLLTGKDKFFTPHLSQTSSKLHSYLQIWRINSQISTPAISVKHRPGKIQARFQRLNDETTLILLDDASQQTQKAQQQKLASLGRLTASIAHEIRNPLGAISHATQLLGESDVLEPADQRLLEIIQNHCVRLNSIIESVMGMSRQSQASARPIRITHWLNEFIAEIRHNPEFQSAQFVIESAPPLLQIWFDPIHLHQVVLNLATNAVRYGTVADNPLIVTLSLSQTKEGNPQLLVMDNGPGVHKDKQDQLFEPFYTTSHEGTGLGLYLSKALCEANKASLQYLNQPEKGACFRILFAQNNKTAGEPES